MSSSNETAVKTLTSPETTQARSTCPVPFHEASTSSPPESSLPPSTDDNNQNSESCEDSDDSEDCDTYRLVENIHKQRKGDSQNKQVCAEVFREWVIENQRESAYAELSILQKQHEQLQVTGEYTGKNIIARPREYQIELFERAKNKNTIVVLDTGSGKTLIAVLLLRHVIEQELDDRVHGKQKRIAFFVVEKVALCLQQYAVLKNNLDHGMALFHGDTSGKINSKEFWDDQFSNNMAIVCTAQILLDCLSNGFITMAQINLLVFDEAHHAKKSHPYAKIMKSYYMRNLDSTTRPRILGMTASPVDAKTSDMRGAALELESMLCSEIATVSDDVLAKSFNARKLVEYQETYSTLLYNCEPTPLWQKIYAGGSSNPDLQPSLNFTKSSVASLGPWCSDRFWSLYMTDVEVTKLTAKTENRLASKAVDDSLTDVAVSAIKQIRSIVKESEFKMPPASRNLDHISPKVEKLWEILENAFRGFEAKRCIVFVEKRSTAMLLADLLQQPGMRIHGVKGSYMTGSKAADSMSFRDQMLALQQFKMGAINCLFATPVAEEGIDIPECDLVIRFDLYNSVIQYIQSKGRARRSNSRFVNMIEEGNMRDLSRLKQANRDWMILRQFCSALPEDRKVQDGIEFDYDHLMAAAAAAEMIGQKMHQTTVGARLSFENSIQVLAKFVSSMPAKSGNTSPDYIVMPVGKKFVAHVNLPETCPIQSVSGLPQRNKQLSRCSAAFEACMILLDKKYGYIDLHLQPVFAKRLPAMRNACLAISSKKAAEYQYRTKPTIWSELGHPKVLYLAILVLEQPDVLGLPSKPIILLSRRKLPSIPTIPLCFGNGRYTNARVLVDEMSLELNDEELEGLRNLTLKIFDDLFSKTYNSGSDEMPYFLAPSIESHEVAIKTQKATVDWNQVRRVAQSDYMDWEGQPDSWFLDKFIIDPKDRSRKLLTKGINHQLKPNDPPPSDAAPPSNRIYRLVEQTIKQYSNSCSLVDRKKMKWRDDQPVVNVEILSLRRDFLDPFTSNDAPKIGAVILEPLKVSSLPLEFITMANLFPSIIHRIDSSLISLEACSLLGLRGIRSDLALEAFTKDSDNTDQHSAAQINFQAGMGKNYERLEFLGDCFLKLATTISLFTILPGESEFEYHVERMVLVCNMNLFNHALKRNLQEYIRSKSFNRRTWFPDMKLVRGKAPVKELNHRLADKSIADVCEAVIGAAYLCDLNLAVKAVTKMVRSKNHKMTCFADYFAAYKAPSWQCPEAIPTSHQNTADMVGKKIGYKFRMPMLARSACKHPSWVYDKVPNYQQLEFLGDALLDMTFVDHLFRRYPNADPQWLTEHKMAMASNQFLGFLCVTLGLHKHLLSIDQALMGQIERYVTNLKHIQEAAQDQHTTTTTPRIDYWRDTLYPPKALPDMVEALIGAIFVDSNYNYSLIQRFTTTHILPYFENMEVYDTFTSQHPVTALEHHLRVIFGCTSWRLCCSPVHCSVEEGVRAITDTDVLCALIVHEKVLEHATAENGRYAKTAVAGQALLRFKDDVKTAEEYRAEVGCDCQER